MYTCIICHEKFNDLFEHLSGKREGMLEIKDEAHAHYFDKIMDSRFSGKGSYYGEPCFCGGSIISIGSGTSDGGATWEDSCTNCNFLYDED